MSRCRTCDAPIRWAVSRETRRPMPLDADPSERGNVAFVGTTEQVEVLGAEEASRRRSEGAILFLSHFVTCPDSGKHRRRA